MSDPANPAPAGQEDADIDELPTEFETRKPSQGRTLEEEIAALASLDDDTEERSAPGNG